MPTRSLLHSEAALGDQITANKRRVALLVIAFVVAVGALGGVAGLLLDQASTGLVVAMVVAGAGAAAAWWRSDAVALRLGRAHPAAEADCPRLYNLVEGLCVASGLPMPRLHLIDDGAPNALAVGRGPRHAALAVTSGLLDKLNRIELEGVLAHELSHVKNHDTRVSTLAVTLVGVVTFGRLTPFALSRRRELVADLSGVSLTRYPPGLIAALEKLRDDPLVVRSAHPATAHLWIKSPAAPTATGRRAPPRGGRRASHPSLDERINLLSDL